MTKEKIKSKADEIVELGAELEAPGHSVLGEEPLEKARAVLHQWIDQMKGIVVNPALGRVSIIQDDGRAASVASADLAFMLSAAGITRSE
jgi:hypothetical protein